MAKSTALSKARADLAAARKRAASYRRESRSVSGAWMPALTVLAGSASAGAARVYLTQQDGMFMGLPIEAVAGIAVGAASATAGSPKGLMYAVGWLAPYISDMVEDQLTQARSAAAAGN